MPLITQAKIKLEGAQRIQSTVHGLVQGIGFRPFVYRLARDLSLSGWIVNTGQGALLEIEGPTDRLHAFHEQLTAELPSAGFIQTLTWTPVPIQGDQSFFIRTSRLDGFQQAVLSPDLATCRDCLTELFDPRSRRYRYPFITCANCGPRYSIVHRLPYDRDRTTMAEFSLCSDCRGEYGEPSDRRFHAETIACPECGPEVAYWDQAGKPLAHGEDALQRACDLLRAGGILGVKGLGGFHLWVHALDREAVERLRLRKHRPSKPFAVLFPSMEDLRSHCIISSKEDYLLRSPAAPIMLVRKKSPSSMAPEVAPGNPCLGAMLPYTPVHHLMTASLELPVVATSGNRSGEPLVYDEHKAVDLLVDMADGFLVHNRPIARPIDDSVVRVVDGNSLMLRRARGFVPTPLPGLAANPGQGGCPAILAVGGHLKNTIALMSDDQIIASQHLGDLSTSKAIAQFEHTVKDFLNLYHFVPQAIACDGHPDYRSARFARHFGSQHRLPIIPVQHHHAHIAACMAEHSVEGPVLGVAWDGGGYGEDGTVWGGEFLRCQRGHYQRIAHLKPFPLPGGEICMREPRRVALSLLYEVFGEEFFQLDLPPLQALGRDTACTLTSMVKQRTNCPLTSSIGRLFDGVSAILGLSQVASFEGEAAMQLEFLADSARSGFRPSPYHVSLVAQSEPEGLWEADWKALIKDIVNDIRTKKSPEAIALSFHLALVQLIADMAERTACNQVVLSGGVFQNTILLSTVDALLKHKGLHIFLPYKFGTNDGGLSVGQCLVARESLSGDLSPS